MREMREEEDRKGEKRERHTQRDLGYITNFRIYSQKAYICKWLAIWASEVFIIDRIVSSLPKVHMFKV